MWKRSVELSRYAVGGAMGIEELRGLKRRERPAEIGRAEGGERKAKAMSERCEKDSGWPRSTQARTGAGPRSGEAIDQAATRRDPR